MINSLDNCTLCAHRCKVNRFIKTGFCRSTTAVKIGLSQLHFFEEPCISGTNGSGTVFFSNCNFNCMYCQNYKISQLGQGEYVSIKDLANIFLDLQEQGAHNINLVTPTSYVHQIIEALDIAKFQGLNIPIVYNTNSYETIQTIELLKGYIDVYLPDLKYYDDRISKKYSDINNYFSVATSAIKAMYNQVGSANFDDNGIIKKGVMIRHLILPGHLQNTKNILKWVKYNMPEDVYISVMSQYFPTYKAKSDNILNKQLSKKEYNEILDCISLLGFENGYIQDLGCNEERYVPNF